MVLYEYGWLAWFWRGLILIGFGLGGVCLWVAVMTPSLPMALAAGALILPSMFFGFVVVVRASKAKPDLLDVETLLLLHRYVHLSRIGVPTVRVRYRGGRTTFHAPRAWVPVRGGLPLYFDLLGHIVDRSAFLRTIQLRADMIRHAD